MRSFKFKARSVGIDGLIKACIEGLFCGNKPAQLTVIFFEIDIPSLNDPGQGGCNTSQNHVMFRWGFNASVGSDGMHSCQPCLSFAMPTAIRQPQPEPWMWASASGPFGQRIMGLVHAVTGDDEPSSGSGTRELMQRQSRTR